MSETFFKDIRVLKGIPVDEFIDTMGMFAAATAKDCTGCHSPQILDGKAESFAIETPMIQKARFMVGMMNAINRNYFGNQKRVTCATCHINTSVPQNVPNMAIQYGEPVENPNSQEFIVAKGSDPAQIDGVFAKYVDALGGAQRLNGVTSFMATGTYSGWDTGLSTCRWRSLRKRRSSTPPWRIAPRATASGPTTGRMHGKSASTPRCRRPFR
jgi:hypothetical protein